MMCALKCCAHSNFRRRRRRYLRQQCARVEASPDCPPLPSAPSAPMPVVVCPAGRANNSCARCPKATWSSGGTLDAPKPAGCKPCDAGRTTPGTGSTNASACSSERAARGGPREPLESRLALSVCLIADFLGMQEGFPQSCWKEAILAICCGWLGRFPCSLPA